MNEQNKNDKPRSKDEPIDSGVNSGASPATKPADPVVQEAKERWEGEGGLAPGKLNQDHPIPDIQIDDGAVIKS